MLNIEYYKNDIKDACNMWCKMYYIRTEKTECGDLDCTLCKRENLEWLTKEYEGPGAKETLHNICRMIVSGDIPHDLQEKFLTNEKLKYMTPLEMTNYLRGEKDE